MKERKEEGSERKNEKSKGKEEKSLLFNNYYLLGVTTFECYILDSSYFTFTKNSSCLDFGHKIDI